VEVLKQTHILPFITGHLQRNGLVLSSAVFNNNPQQQTDVLEEKKKGPIIQFPK